MNAPGKHKVARNGYIAISVIFYLTGMVHMICLSIPIMALCIIGAGILIAYGVIKMIGYFSDDLYCLAFQYDMACGLLLLIVGMIVLGWNLRLEPYLAPGLGFLILLDSLLKVQTSREAKAFGLQSWHWILIAAVIAGIFGILIVLAPFRTERAAHIVTGCGLLLEGGMNHLVVKAAVRM
ncbi:MAG: hypothetical protein K2P65_12435 [Lachnospiraceae bacterium]|nr:hypothetical protein [Lachnospiraceae bacterium]